MRYWELQGAAAELNMCSFVMYGAHPQVWQWVKHRATLEPGNQTLTADRFNAILAEELDKIRVQVRLRSAAVQHVRS